MTEFDEHQKALIAGRKYMGQVDTLRSIAVESTKESYLKSKSMWDSVVAASMFTATKKLVEQLAKAIDRPLKGEWWKE